MHKLLLYNGKIVNEGVIIDASIEIINDKISNIILDCDLEKYIDFEIFDATGLYILPGVIDTHVHFREPGLTKKGDIESESRAAVAGGVTTFFDMPNTIPQAITIEHVEEKFKIAEKKSYINYSFFIGAANNNLQELNIINPREIAGIKLFYASSTGNMLVDRKEIIENLFQISKLPIVVHSEDQNIINKNISDLKKQNVILTAENHADIRSAEACFKATEFLVNLAKKYNTKIHFLHISSADELKLFSSETIENKNITAETTPNYLHFDSSDYKTLKMLIKCNPAIKSHIHKNALIQAINQNIIDTIATDHAPHEYSEKLKEYEQAPSGIPSIQNSLNIMIDLAKNKHFSIQKVVEVMCHNPAKIFKISKRGFIKKDYFADITIVDLNKEWILKKEDILYKCAWSPMENHTFQNQVVATLVNGKFVYKNGIISENKVAQKIIFDR